LKKADDGIEWMPYWISVKVSMADSGINHILIVTSIFVTRFHVRYLYSYYGILRLVWRDFLSKHTTCAVHHKIHVCHLWTSCCIIYLQGQYFKMLLLFSMHI